MNSSYHEFLLRYSKSKRVVYGFAEGKDDPCFYRGFIENQIPENWSVELWAAGNKDQVYRIHSDINWRRFPKTRVCFFVDRDLSALIPVTLAQDSNIYVTDSYSIENELVNRGTCRRVLTEICGFGNIDHQELDQVCDLFDQEMNKYLHAMIPIMAWILSWQRNGKRPNLNNLVMRHLFSVVDGCLHVKSSPNGKANVAEYIHCQCSIDYEPNMSVSSFQNSMVEENVYKKYTRGKFMLWFLVEFCLSIRKAANKLFKSCKKVPPMHVTLSHSNGVVIIGPRARVPKSLRIFLKNTFCKYILMTEA